MNDKQRLSLTASEVCGIVVTYNPDREFPKRLDRLAKQVDCTVVVDNHSSDTCLGMLKKTSAELGTCLIRNEDNLGIATALNQGVKFARDRGYKWAITLDQDTVPCEEMLEIVINAYEGCRFREHVGIVGSNYYDQNSGRSPIDKKEHSNCDWLEMRDVITSGSLMSISVYQSIGAFRDDFFIDYVDVEYCLRLKNNGYRVIIATRPGMIHGIGNTSVRKFLGRKVSIYNHSPVRSYYGARNQLFVVRQYFWDDPYWGLSTSISPIINCLKAMLFEKDKMLKVKYSALGVYDALHSRGGRLPQ